MNAMNRPAALPPRLRFALAGLALCAIAFWFINEPFLQGKTTIPGDLLLFTEPWNSIKPPTEKKYWNAAVSDAVQQVYPWRVFYHRWIQKGVVPLWNPHIFAGAPFVANNQSAVFYPLNFLFYGLMEPAAGWDWCALLHLCMTGCFMLAFLRAAGLSVSAGFVGGLLYMLNGWLSVWMTHQTYLCAAAWIPFGLLGIQLARRPRSRLAGWLTLAAASVMELLAGHFQVSFFAFLVWGAFGIYALAAAKRGGRRPLALALAFGVAAGAAVGMAQVVPTWALSKEASRLSPGYGGYVRTAIPGHMLITFLLPDFFGSPAKIKSGPNADKHLLAFSPGAYAESVAYLGLAALCLPFFALTGKRTRGPGAFFLAVAAAGILCAYGSWLNWPLFAAFPPVRLMRVNRFLALAAAGLPVASAYGWEALTRTGLRFKTRLIACLLLGAALVGAAALLWPFAHGAWPKIPGDALWKFNAGKTALAGLSLAAALGVICLASPNWRTPAVGLLAAAVLFDLGLWGRRYIPKVERADLFFETPAIRFLMDHKAEGRFHSPEGGLFPNDSMVFELNDIRGYDSLFPKSILDYYNAMLRRRGEKTISPSMNVLTTALTDDPGLDALNLRYALSSTPIEGGIEGFAAENHIYVRPHAWGWGKLFSNWKFVPEGQGISRGNEEFQKMREDKLHIPFLILEGSLEPLDRPNGSPMPETTILEDTPAKFSIKASSSSPAMLFLSRAWDKGWKATVNGKAAPIYKAFGLFQAIPISSMDSVVTLEYRPAAAIFAFRFSAACLAGLLAGALVVVRQRKNGA